jgi:type II secretory pathway predicted ATPase ExeA
MIIRAYYGLKDNPFSMEKISLLPHQEAIFEVLKVHTQQGGLCVIIGDPGTGKSVIKEAVKQQTDEDKHLIVASIGRTLHTYFNTVKILCKAFKMDFEGNGFKCEKRLIEEAFKINREGKRLITIIDDAHLMDTHTLRKLRLLFEDFPKNHNLILIGQPVIMYNLSLTVNEDIKSRITYSTQTPKLNPDDIRFFVTREFDRVAIPHNIFTEDAFYLMVKVSEGYLRRVRNLCISCLLESVRAQKKEITLDMVNAVLMQPHWRKEYDMDKI